VDRFVSPIFWYLSFSVSACVQSNRCCRHASARFAASADANRRKKFIWRFRESSACGLLAAFNTPQQHLLASNNTLQASNRAVGAGRVCFARAKASQRQHGPHLGTEPQTSSKYVSLHFSAAQHIYPFESCVQVLRTTVFIKL